MRGLSSPCIRSYWVKANMDDDNISYLNARVSAMKSKLLPLITYQKMLLMELPEITRYISEGEYHEDVTELAKSFRGVDLIEYALNLNLARTYQKLITISEGMLHELIVGYMQRWDISNIKAILRGLQSGTSEEEIAETLVPVGSLSFSYLLSLTRKDYESVKGELEKKKILPVGYESLQELETELDRRYYQDLIALADDVGEELLVSFLRREVDMRNIKIMLRLVHEGADFELIRKELLPSGNKVTPATCEKFKGLTFEEVVKKINGLYHDFELRPDEPLTIMEQDVDKQHILYGEKISHLHMFTPLMVLGFILRKYQEIVNLRLITRGKQLDIPPETIERMLVV
ncbi:hypothetical protein EF808_02510 [archaeon]|nr:MAG: hypothetical protein EF808_02510 [archaeon]